MTKAGSNLTFQKRGSFKKKLHRLFFEETSFTSLKGALPLSLAPCFQAAILPLNYQEIGVPGLWPSSPAPTPNPLPLEFRKKIVLLVK